MIGRRLGARVRRTDAMLVAHDRRRRVFVVGLDLVLFMAGVVAWALAPVAWRGNHVVWATLASLVVGLQLGRTGIMTLRRAGAYRSGWLAGRQQMVIAMAEAQRRGMTPMEWLDAELHRDYAVLGIDPQQIEELAEEIRRHEDGDSGEL